MILIFMALVGYLLRANPKNRKVLGDVKKHMKAFGINIPFLHDEHKDDDKKGGAAGMYVGGLLKGLF